MNEKQRWETKTDEDKRNETIFNLILHDFDEDEIDDEELDTLIADINLDDMKGMEKITECKGFADWKVKNDNRISTSVAAWEKKMKEIYG